MAEPTRYEVLRDRIRRKYNLSATDVDNVVMEELFGDVLDTYSRFRGLEDQQKITFDSGTTDYTLGAAVHYVIEALWNETFPDDSLLSASFSREEYDTPSIRLIKDVKQAIYRASRIKSDQRFQVYNSDDATKKIHLIPGPYTDIYIIFRKLFTKTTYPSQDEKIIRLLYEAMFLQHCQSTGIEVQVGDIRYDQPRMDTKIKDLENQFYRHATPYTIGRS